MTRHDAVPPGPAAVPPGPAAAPDPVTPDPAIPGHAPIPDPAATSPIALRPMTRAHLPAVLRLEADLFGDEAWSEAMLVSELEGTEASGRYYLIAEDSGGLVGYAGLLSPGGTQADVLTMAVAEDHWGRRIGAMLLDSLLAEAARRGCSEVFLEVRVDNDRAQRLYYSRGFAEIGIRRGYYQPSGTDALVMQASLSRPRRDGFSGPRGDSGLRGDSGPRRDSGPGTDSSTGSDPGPTHDSDTRRPDTRPAAGGSR